MVRRLAPAKRATSSPGGSERVEPAGRRAWKSSGSESLTGSGAHLCCARGWSARLPALRLSGVGEDEPTVCGEREAGERSLISQVAGAGSVRISPTTRNDFAGVRTRSRKCASSHEQADLRPVWAARCSSAARGSASLVSRSQPTPSHPKEFIKIAAFATFEFATRRWIGRAGYPQRGNSEHDEVSDRLLLTEGCLLRRVRQCHVRAREHLGEISLLDLYRGGPELAQQHVGRLVGERADVEALQLGTAGPE
jgi:hypothetical protein